MGQKRTLVGRPAKMDTSEEQPWEGARGSVQMTDRPYRCLFWVVLAVADDGDAMALIPIRGYHCVLHGTSHAKGRPWVRGKGTEARRRRRRRRKVAHADLERSVESNCTRLLLEEQTDRSETDNANKGRKSKTWDPPGTVELDK